MSDYGAVRNEELNLSEAMKNATEVSSNSNAAYDENSEELTSTVGGIDWAVNSGLVVNNTESTELSTTTEVTSVSIPDKPQIPDTRFVADITDTGGIIINNKDLTTDEPSKPAANELSPDTMSAISAYTKDMDEQIEQAKKDYEERKKKEEEKNTDDDDEEDPGMTKDQMERTYNEAVVIIDKTGMGIVNFTDEERAKLEKAKKIRLEEVETIELKTIKTKKSKKGNIDKLLKRQANLHTTPIVLPASGYTAQMRGCSTYELISLIQTSDNALLTTEAKWSIIHSKLTDPSIGEMDYNTFLQNTAAVDYNVFLFGLLCATYPDDDKISLKCEKCGKDFDHNYSVKSLIRAERMSDRMKDIVVATVDHSHTENDAKMFHSQAAVSQSKVIKLPVSGYLVEIYVQSAYDFINRSIKELSENKDPKYNQASIMSSMVNKIYIPDPDSDEGEYYDIDSAMDITKVIYSLGDTDIMVLSKQSELAIQDLTFEFGFMNVTCPHCKLYTPVVPIDLEYLLFYKYQQAVTTKIE